MDQKCVRCGCKTEERVASRLRSTGRRKRKTAYYFSTTYISRNKRERAERWCSALAARRQTSAGNHLAHELIYAVELHRLSRCSRSLPMWRYVIRIVKNDGESFGKEALCNSE